ncbi:TetR/AcrR family transcriptional regulator [Litoribrevibacter albus]|uniref:TetR family transcriptional regulator n=1 Tax=Litoribrevibacter albus TaxID=1473156 RepID=A0AA37W6B1_9GAMM|nr:TetR/AcrR family transcriptional regulator [Litoribrevibacter albus]GLQ30133.1 TetR family transcriptional regulator [Litoribrevibacter albus]
MVDQKSESQKKRSVSEQKRQSILDAAKETFVEQGYLATSMDAVAAKAGVSKRTVYNHFPSKEVLFSSIILELLNQTQGIMQFSFDAQTPVRPQLIEIARLKMQLFSNEDSLPLTRLILSETIRDPEKMMRVLSELEEAEAGFIHFLDEAGKAGKLRISNSQRAANQFFSLIKGEIFWPMILKGKSFPDDQTCLQVIEEATDMFLAYYGND